MQVVKLPSGFLELKPGDVVVGRSSVKTYIGKDSSGPRGQLEAHPRQGGEVAWLPGHVALTRKLQQVPPGSIVQVTALGTSKKKTRFGNKDVYDYEVAILNREDMRALLEAGSASLGLKRLLAAPKETAAVEEVDGEMADLDPNW